MIVQPLVEGGGEDRHVGMRFGHPRDAVIGRDIFDLLVPAAYRDEHRAVIRKYLATGSAGKLNRRVEIRAMRADASEFPCEVAVIPIKIEGTRNDPKFGLDVGRVFKRGD